MKIAEIKVGSLYHLKSNFGSGGIVMVLAMEKQEQKHKWKSMPPTWLVQCALLRNSAYEGEIAALDDETLEIGALEWGAAPMRPQEIDSLIAESLDTVVEAINAARKQRREHKAQVNDALADRKRRGVALVERLRPLGITLNLSADHHQTRDRYAWATLSLDALEKLVALLPRE